MLTPQVPVAKEGYPFIGLFAFVALFFALLGNCLSAYILLAATLFTVYFFRDPERFVPSDPRAIIAPADGKVIVASQVETNPFLPGPAVKVSIFMNVFNVHVNRLPVTGVVDEIRYRAGKFYSADTERGAEHNEHCAAIVTTDQGEKLAFVQVAGLIARRIVCWLEPGDQVLAGKRYGLIRFGSRVDLYLPPHVDLQVAIGQKVKAGESVLGRLQ